MRNSSQRLFFKLEIEYTVEKQFLCVAGNLCTHLIIGWHLLFIVDVVNILQILAMVLIIFLYMTRDKCAGISKHTQHHLSSTWWPTYKCISLEIFLNSYSTTKISQSLSLQQIYLISLKVYILFSHWLLMYFGQNLSFSFCSCSSKTINKNSSWI